MPSFDEGPYGNLSTMYSVLTAVWVLLTAWWIRQAFFVHSKSCVRLCKSVSVVPATKCITVLFTLAFWVTCDSWKMCSSALAVVVANCQLVYESTVIWMFLCVALGWEEVDSERSGQKVRRVTGATLLFYACASALMIGKQSNISRVKYLALIVTLYSAAYGYIAYSAHSNVRAVQKDVSLLLQHQVPDGYLRPLRYKLSSRAAFLVLVLLVIVAEAVVHAMMNSSAGFGAAIMIYELLNVLLITSVLYAYRPQEYNPFYFMQRVGGAHDVRDDERRGVATVEVQAEAVGKAAPFAADVELLPLIAHRDEVAMPARLVVVRCPASLAVATSVEMS